MKVVNVIKNTLNVPNSHIEKNIVNDGIFYNVKVIVNGGEFYICIGIFVDGFDVRVERDEYNRKFDKFMRCNLIEFQNEITLEATLNKAIDEIIAWQYDNLNAI